LPNPEAIAATYYVSPPGNDSNSGTESSPWGTIQKAADTLAAGDTVIVQAGTYNERVTPARSGTPGNPITFLAGSGPRPKLRGFTLNSRSHISVNGFEITTSGFSSDSNPSFLASGTTNIKILNNYIHDTSDIGLRSPPSSSASAKSFNMHIKGNTFAYIGSPGSRTMAIQVWGNGTLVEDNDFSHTEDMVRVHGHYIVVRNNTMHDTDEADAGGGHIDGVQSFCPSAYPGVEVATYLLVEGNYHHNNPDSNSHFALINATDSCGGTTEVILRQNRIFNLGSTSYVSDTNQSFGSYHKYYNNTTLNGRLGSSGGTTININGIAHAAVINNIFVDAIDSTSRKMYSLDSSGTSGGDYNLAYMTSGSVTWADPIASEPHGIRDQNPLFVSSTDFHLQSGSPARDAGGPLTTVVAGDSGSGTSLLVADAHFFQDGWAGVNPDWVAVGTTGNVAQISSIDYSSNTLTLASSLARQAGDSVWLFKDSSGRQVLYGSAPDIGAFEYVTTGSETTPPSAPGNFRIR
jgi:hypothetical protein